VISVFYMIFGITFFVLAIVNISQFANKLSVMRTWVDYAPCVDSYMQVTSYQVREIEKASAFASVVVAMACIIFVTAIISCFGNCIVCCCKR
jgi:hypothetical protein